MTNGNDYFLFIDLHKDADINERINYKDKLIDPHTFQWQTPNSTRQDSDRGRNIMYNQERGIRLHLFLRKYKKIDGLVQPYIYIGMANSIPELCHGNQPITVIMKLEHEVPATLYTEFVEQV